ncbi:tubby-related protein 4 [Microplitis demolitor]|uniref:tubby-related protein 4 n=1 Tax=Microplitis demolitor TaxID=69319 RepID=UPI0006D4DA00|nr:tubby-related protein 4 [Microplitis demolitor]
MHLHFEKNNNAKCDCNILSLSWMGKVPDELPEDEGWKLNRTNYYQEGWLATGNARGLVGVTFTTSHCRTRTTENPLRANYNLRGHQSEVILVKWNEPYQKLASCDSSGVIFVWIKYEGRWSIELINDRSTPVTHFSWSHDGRMALICYRDGFVLVGSVAGQRYWSSMLNDQATITCGIWTPDDQQVYFGTTSGQLIVMDVHGAMVSEVQLSSGITSMAWSAEKFKMEEGDDDVTGNQTQQDERTYVLAVCLADGNIVMLRSYDDLSPITIKTGLKAPLFAEWSNSRKLLAIAGTKESDGCISTNNPPEYNNFLKFYSDTGTLIYTTAIPYTQCQVSALTWGHNDRRLFIATGAKVHAAWVSRRVGSLQLLSRLAVRASLTRESSVQQLPLPPRLRALVAALFASTIRSCVPEPRELRKFVSRPPPSGGRLHCTMLRHAGEPAPCYTLYLEYLGGLVPLLKGRRTSKIRPEFVIFDPQSQDTLQIPDYSFPSFSDGSDTERDTAELCGSPRNKRKNRRRRDDKSNDESDDLTYVDTLPEDGRLVEVTSNIWGTKFKIHGLTDSVPANLGQVTYRTSLLHLQPRQMTLVMTELRDDLPAGPDPSFNPNLFSEDEEETFQEPQGASRPISEATVAAASTAVPPPPIAPMTSRNTRLSQSNNNTNNNHNRPKSQISNQFIPTETTSPLSTTTRADDSYDEDFPYVDRNHHHHHHHYHHHHQGMLEFCENLRATSSNYRTSRHNQPRCCDVPALQSPKNAVAPTQTLIATSNANNDYSNNIQRVKTTLIAEQQQTIRKEFENNKINNHVDDKNLLSGHHQSLTNIIPTLHLQNGQNNLPTPRCSTNPGSTSPIYNNFPNSNNSFVHKTNSNKSGCFTSNLNSPSGNNQTLTSSSFITKNNLGSPNGNALSITTSSTSSSSSSSYTPGCQCIHKRKETKVTTGCCGKPGGSHTNQVGITQNGKIIEELRFIDEESKDTDFSQFRSVHRTPTVVSIGPMCPVLDPMVRSCSVGYLDLVDAQMVPCDVALKMLRKEAPNKRLVLVSRKTKKRRKNKTHNDINQQCNNSKPRLRTCGKSRSLDSSDMFPSTEQILLPPQLLEHVEEVAQIREHDDYADGGISKSDNVDKIEVDNSAEKDFDDSKNCQKDNAPTGETKSSDSLSSSLDGLAARLRDFDDANSLPPPSPRSNTRLPRSSPSSPAPTKKGKRPASASPIRRRLLSSPLLNRRTRKSRGESSDDEGAQDDSSSRSYRNLETFQKAQLRQKLKQRGTGTLANKAEELVMHNKAPMWNESSQVYQLDFGGRVTQESAKNFQIEYRGKQVMQFGRIDGNAYTLDFQYPFSALQAFAVALANVTQRLK